MSVEVSLKDIVDELEFAADEYGSYLNKATGEIVGLIDEHLSLAEDVEGPEDLEGYPDWQKDVIAEAIAVQFSGEYIKLPTKYDIHEYSIMERFIYSIEDDRLSDRLLRAIRGRGAFRYFKDTVYEHGIESGWYAYRTRALEEIAIEWLDDHRIPWHRGADKGDASIPS